MCTQTSSLCAPTTATTTTDSHSYTHTHKHDPVIRDGHQKNTHTRTHEQHILARRARLRYLLHEHGSFFFYETARANIFAMQNIHKYYFASMSPAPGPTALPESRSVCTSIGWASPLPPRAAFTTPRPSRSVHDLLRTYSILGHLSHDVRSCRGKLVSLHFEEGGRGGVPGWGSMVDGAGATSDVDIIFAQRTRHGIDVA